MVKKIQNLMLALLVWAAATVSAQAADYTTYLTQARGFTEITNVADISDDADYCYILVAAETTELYVGVGRYEAKPDWAGEDTKALRYKLADRDPVADLSNFFTIEKKDGFIGFRNLFYNTSLFQTHDNAGYMYVLTYTEPTMSEWTYLTPTFQEGYWLFESGKYPISSENWACGYMGPWNNRVAAGEPIALNRRNTVGDEAGHYRLFRINKEMLLYQKELLLNQGTFTAVALNVDGLPNKVATISLNEDGPGGDGTKKISQYIASKGYDMVGCSEDFNYHGSLISWLQDDYSWGAVRATLSISGLPWDQIFQGKFRFDTDGLNLLWKNSKIKAENESWTEWNSMEATDGNQYVRKGYRHYDVTLGLEGGPVIDVFVLHMDAGSNEAVINSRHSQWEQLCDAVNATDPTRPKLIIGDTNSRWTREDIKAHFMNRLNGSLKAHDVWVELYRGGVYPTTSMEDLTDQSNLNNYNRYEVVDKIIYVNPKDNSTLQLKPTKFKIEQDYTYDYIDHDGNTKPLGDHRPVVVTFKYSKPVVAPSGIESLENDEVVNTRSAKGPFVNAWYSLDGRRLNGKPTVKGLYIHNGHKVAL